MFNRNQIISMTNKHRAKCACVQCSQPYECNIYDAAKSKVGHLCESCKTQITSLKYFTRHDLNRVFDYDELTGIVTYKQDSLSGLKGDKAGYSHAEGYLSLTIGRKEYLLHRIIWFMKTDTWPTQVDHENHNRADNRWANLRDISSQENQKNMGVGRKNNSTGVIGVRILPSGKFNAYIMVNRKQIGLGSYDTLEEAKAARKNAEARYGFHINHGT